MCGAKMIFEDEWERFMVCPSCGDSIDLEEEDDMEYPTLEEVLGVEEGYDEDDQEYYDEVYDELDDD